MSNEREWVAALVQRLDKSIQTVSTPKARVSVVDGKRLPYVHEVLRYTKSEPVETSRSSYETDLLVFDDLGEDSWTPRVIIECKLGSVTTHDAITYSAKAATHKQVHPYLRYGILIGHRKDFAIPGRLFRHGAYFDFMATWKGDEASKAEWDDLIGVLIDEVIASRLIGELVTTSRLSNRRKYTLVHRPLKFK